MAKVPSWKTKEEDLLYVDKNYKIYVKGSGSLEDSKRRYRKC